jgi:exopolysaccharide production protein ExoY
MTIVNANIDVASAALEPRVPRGGLLKRLFDVIAASLLLFAFLPLIFFIGVIMFSTESGGVFFAHDRVGYRGKSFRCLKFRSMVANAEEALARYIEENPSARDEWNETQKLRDDPRITKLGKFLRETSLDELPQLINVLLGDMSLVGPRPIVQNEIQRYADRFDHYVRARPGITGLWQVSGRSDVGYEQRVELDSAYVTGWSFSGDMLILMQTVRVVFTRAGSY